MVIFGIESSCDETAAAVVRDKKEVLSSNVASQIDTHKDFGGVVPEVASRLHVENVSWVIDEAIKQSGLSWDEIDAIAVTQGPGLIGSLHVGVQASKTLALLFDKPLIPVNHLAGHIYANELVTEMHYPLLALLVSGGNSELIYMKDETSFEVLGETQDDAIGEAYDKISRVLGQGYPGGPVIDKLAKQGEAIYPLPKPKAQGEYNFSFSGLKSGVLQFVQREARANKEWKVEDLAASFQKVALDEIFDKVRKALDAHPEVQSFVVGGGVSANSRLREIVKELEKEYPDVTFTVPPMRCCTDNATMIAVAGEIAYELGRRAGADLTADAAMEIC